MIITCRCGVILSAERDGILDAGRELRMQQRLGTLAVNHLAKCDPEAFSRAYNLAAEFVGWQIACRFRSADPEFNEWLEQGRKRFEAIFAPASASEDPSILARKGEA